MTTTSDDFKALQRENEQLRAQLQGSQETLLAIREGGVEALASSGPQGDRVFTPQRDEQPYRLLIEQMRDGAVMLGREGAIRYANRAFADMVGRPLEQVIGSAMERYVAPTDRALFDALLHQTLGGTAGGEVSLCAADGRLLPAYLGLSTMVVDGVSSICLVATDLTGQKHTRQLLASEEMHRVFFDLAPVGMTYVAPDRRIVKVNERYCEITGYTREELLGMPVLDLTHPDDREAEHRQYSLYVRGEQPVYRTENRYLRKDGTVRWVAVTARMVHEADGRPRYSLGVVEDITERKQAEETLRRSEERFRALADAITNLAWWANADGYITWYNRRWYEYTGTTPEQMEGWGWQMVHDPQALLEVMARWKASIATGEPFEMTFPLRGRDGQFRRFLTRIVPLKDAQGRVTRWFGTNTDVEELKRAEEALRQSEEQLRLAQQSANVGIWDWNVQTGALDFTPELNKIYGLPPGTIKTYEDWRVRVHADDIGRVETERDEAIARHESFDLEFRGRHSSGEYRWISAKGGAIYDESGKATRMFGVNIDITGRKRAEEELHRLNRTLRALSSSNQAMMRTGEEARYVREVCAIVVKDCGHTMAWVGYARQDDGQSVEAVAHAGLEEGYLRTSQISWADTEYGRGPTGTAIRTGAAVICNNMLTDARMGPWRAEAAKRGYAASISLPLLDDGRAFGALTIYSSQPAPFSDEEVALLRELAADLAHGIMAIRLREAHAQATEALRRRAEELQQLLDVVPAAVWVANDAQCLQITGNPTADEFYEARTGENVSATTAPETRRFFTHDGRELAADELPMQVAAATNQAVRDVELNVSLASGRRLTIVGSAVPLRDEKSEVRGCIGAFINITERKRAEDALRFLAQCAAAPGRDFFQELARYLAESLGMDFVCIDTLHDDLLAARTLAMYFDGKFEDNVSYALKDTPCGDVVGKSICCFPQGVRHRFPKDVVLQDMVAESYVGTTLWSSHGQPIGLIAVIGRRPLADVTLATSILQLVAVRAAGELERRQAEEALATAKAAAEHASKAKDHFLAVLSHELRNPLNPVLATAAMLRDDPRLDADTREQLEVIHRNVELEARLIDDLLDVTRIERGKVELDRQPIELGTVIQRAVEVCQPDIEGRQLHFCVDIPDGPYLVDADAARLQQVFWNLLKNAIKFTPHGGCVGIRCRREGEGLVVAEVTDSGVGLEADALDRIFNAFEQAERSITRKFGGLGLGLTISKAMVEMHGGHIVAHSPGKGQGATFTIRLPLLPAEAAVTAPPPPAQAPRRNMPIRRLRILLVEDHGDTARIMKRLLSADGHEVQIAADVATALTLAGEHTFDLMLSDLGLPDGSGLDLMRALRAKGITMPGIALSGYGQENDLQQSREAGFVAHQTKPVSLPKLEEAMAKIVGE